MSGTYTCGMGPMALCKVGGPTGPTEAIGIHGAPAKAWRSHEMFFTANKRKMDRDHLHIRAQPGFLLLGLRNTTFRWD